MKVATHPHAQWQGAAIPPKTLLFLNSWACARDPFVFDNLDEFAPEMWMDGEQTASKYQFAFGIGGRINPKVVDPLLGLLARENPIAAPVATAVRFIPRNRGRTRLMLAVQD
ncbi:hypothetical protein BCR34DRAFT_559069 [Clohesyomyces aquaticus]|uniref:Uncharacterized protein n=1 Tax=Clohesyomyces aquaticus TaxID=1231657 RepID=A0A1Y1ZYL3_9PLEO|nr:hypothetical protein BCR34DRAFT_559069 [Clohesyomyces aquaticus]